MAINRKTLLAIGASAIILMGAGCAKQKTEVTTDLSNVEGNKPYAEESTAALTVANQTVLEGTVTIPSITLAADGWAVVRADNAGVPGEIIGKTAVAAGQQTNVMVSIEISKATPILHIVLHTDVGTKGEFEYPGADVPVTANDVGLSGSFKAEISETGSVKTESAEKSGIVPQVEKEVKTEAKIEAKIEVKSAVRDFAITAKNWEFTPSTITVKKGDTVRLSIKSVDVDHGFRLDEFNVNKVLKPGETATVEFIADKSGSFPFSCNVFCGSGHKDMRGTLIVE